MHLAHGLRPQRLAAAVGLGAVASILLGACSPRAAPPAPDPPRLVLWVSLDTFRADLLDESAPDGAARTPSLRSLAGEAVSFSRAFAPIPFTLPSHVSMLTGLPPSAHGVIDDRRRLATDVPTLPAALARRGYATSAIVNCLWLRAEFGLDRGFDDYTLVPGLVGSASSVTDRAAERLRAAAAARRPLFLFVHYYEAHSDYPSQGTRLTYFSPEELRRDLPGEPDEGHCATVPCGTPLLAAVNAGTLAPDLVDRELQHELYRRGATYLDREIGRLLDAVRTLGLWDQALVVVTADHGEAFGEHGKFLHDEARTETTRVPLLLKPAGSSVAERRDDRLASLLDLAPTIARLTGADWPSNGVGRDLLHPATEGRVLLIEERHRPTRFALRANDLYFIHDYSSGAEELYRSADDARELDDVGEAAGSEELRRLRATLDDALRQARAFAPTSTEGEAMDSPFDEREREDLRSLGYL